MTVQGKPRGALLALDDAEVLVDFRSSVEGELRLDVIGAVRAFDGVDVAGRGRTTDWELETRERRDPKGPRSALQVKLTLRAERLSDVVQKDFTDESTATRARDAVSGTRRLLRRRSDLLLALTDQMLVESADNDKVRGPLEMFQRTLRGAGPIDDAEIDALRGEATAAFRDNADIMKGLESAIDKLPRRSIDPPQDAFEARSLLRDVMRRAADGLESPAQRLYHALIGQQDLRLDIRVRGKGVERDRVSVLVAPRVEVT